MNAGALLIPVNACYFARVGHTGDRKGAVVQRSICAGGPVKNKGNTSAAARPRSPLPAPTYGLKDVIAFAASHNQSIWSARIKPKQPDAPTEQGARHC